MSYIRADSRKEQEHFDFLEELRQSGATNMWGASPYLVDAYNIPHKQATEILVKWMKLHEDPTRTSHNPITFKKGEKCPNKNYRHHQ